MAKREVDTSDLEKIHDALLAASEHHISRDKSNAALHLARETRYSPLTSQLTAERDRVWRLMAPDDHGETTEMDAVADIEQPTPLTSPDLGRFRP
jgi:hypothetical protein